MELLTTIGMTLLIMLIGGFILARFMLKKSKEYFTTEQNETGLSVYRKYKVGQHKVFGEFYIKVYVPDETRGNRIIEILNNEVENINSKNFEMTLSEQSMLEIISILTNLKVSKKINEKTGEFEQYGTVTLEQFLEENKRLDAFGRLEGLLQQVNQDVGDIVSQIFNYLFGE